MRRSAACLIVLVAFPLAGCTTTGTTASSKFTGTASDVAKVVGDLQAAGQRKDSTKLCTQVFSRSLVGKLATGGTTCKAEMDKAMADADEFTVTVQDVKVTGNTATATVHNGSSGPVKTLQLVREGPSWRISGLG